MTTPRDVYINGIYKRFTYFATWLPNAPIRLGDVGVIKNGKYFQRVTSLKKLEIPFKVRVGTKPIDFHYSFYSNLSAQTDASSEVAVGTLPSLIKNNVIIEFSREGSFLFQAINCLVDEIEDKVELGRKVIDFYRSDKWDDNWCVVDTVVNAGNTTIFVSNSQNAQVELSASVNLPIQNLADPNAGLTIHSQKGEITQFLADEGLTPLFKLSKVRKSILPALIKKDTITFGGKKTLADAGILPADEELWETVAPY